jgi:hypothetical protein
VREGGKRGKRGLVMLLTATWSSCGTCSMAEGGGAAARRAAEVQRWRACAARVCEARVAAL